MFVCTIQLVVQPVWQPFVSCKWGITKLFEFNASGGTRGHSLKLLKTWCTKYVRKYFFSYRVINRWNGLTKDIVNSPSINSFKNKLQKLRDTRIGFFLDWCLQPLGCTLYYIGLSGGWALPMYVVQWSNHLGAMCSRAWRSQWPRIDSSLSPWCVRLLKKNYLK